MNPPHAKAASVQGILGMKPKLSSLLLLFDILFDYGGRIPQACLCERKLNAILLSVICGTYGSYRASQKPSGKESSCSAGDMGSISGSGRSPGEGSLGNLMYRGTWWAAVLRVAKKSDTTTSDYPLPDSFEILKITKKNFLQVCSFDVPLNKNEVPQGIQLILSNLFLRELFLPSLGKEILTNWECE